MQQLSFFVVYCPDPVEADKAKVTFEAAVRIEKYTVWYVNADFSSWVADKDHTWTGN